MLIIFDSDGTIIKSAICEATPVVLMECFSENGVPSDKKEAAADIVQAKGTQILNMINVSHRGDTSTGIIKEVSNITGLTLPGDVYVGLTQQMSESRDQFFRDNSNTVSSNIIPLLKRLDNAGVKYVCTTNSSAGAVSKHIESAEYNGRRGSLTNHFCSEKPDFNGSALGGVFGTGVEGDNPNIYGAPDLNLPGKPAPDMLRRAIKDHGYQNRLGEVMYIGDSVYDIQAAQAAGIETIIGYLGSAGQYEEALKAAMQTERQGIILMDDYQQLHECLFEGQQANVNLLSLKVRLQAGCVPV